MAPRKNSPPRGIRQTSLGAHIVRTPIKKGTHTPTSGSKKKGARQGAAAAAANQSQIGSPTPTARSRPRIEDGGKYGFCPSCAIGRRVRNPIHNQGNALNRGKFRFICSRKNEGLGCDYLEVLDSDPADDPGLYKAASTRVPQAIDLDEGEEDEEDQEDDDDEVKVVGQVNLGIKGFRTPAKKMMGNNIKATAGKDKPQNNIGCPECIMGKLAEKIKSTFLFTETILVCQKIWDPVTRKVVGGCGYKLEIAKTAAGDVESGAPQAKRKDEVKDKDAKDLEREKKELEELVATEREKARKNPNAAVVMAGPADNTPKKILVDLTDDDEMLGLLPPSGPSADTMIGAQAPIVIEDDEQEERGEFERMGSADERELVRMADEALQAAAVDLDEQEERELVELAVKVEASQH